MESQSREVMRLGTSNGSCQDIENLFDSTDFSEMTISKQYNREFKYQNKGETVAVTPFRVEAQERIRRLGCKVEFSKRTRKAELFSSYAKFDSTMVTTRRKKSMFNYKKGNVSAKIYRRSHFSSDFAQPAEDTITSAENLSVISIDSPFAPSVMKNRF